MEEGGGLRGGAGRLGEEDRGGTETSTSHTVDCSSRRFGFLYRNSFLFYLYVFILTSSTTTRTHTQTCTRLQSALGTATQSTPLAPRSGQLLALLFILLASVAPPAAL